MNDSTAQTPRDFIRQAVVDDLESGRYAGPIVTRFPPEPNAFLHIGHAKAMCIDFDVAAEFGGWTNLRFDDTNPTREAQVYIDAIKEDVAWLGFEWAGECYASDYFQTLYDWAMALTKAGLAYVDDQTAELIRSNRGTLTTPGTPSPYRDRPVDENVDRLKRMQAGEFADGQCVLRAKIDMAAPNINLRDPVMYRIMHLPHPRTGDAWCIYPSYDWAHGQSDWIEGVTHSLCSLEFEDHRPLYDWFVDRLMEIGVRSPAADHRPRQIEFARGNITYMVTSKRRLLELIDSGAVADWDDPRMPTLRGLRRRGVPPAAIRRFWGETGVAKRVNNIEYARFEGLVRDELNRTATRRMAVLDPLRLVVTDYPEDRVEMMTAVNNPEDETAGTRQVPFCRELLIERNDFMEDPPRKFFRLAPGREVRLRYGYWVTCTDVIKDDAGKVVELRCTHDPQTRGGDNPPPDAEGKVRKVKGTLHWVSAQHAVDVEARLYEHLFTAENPLDVADGEDWLTHVNHQALTTVIARAEPALAEARPDERFQFERTGYFTVDADSTPARPIFNRTATLKDTWAKMSSKQ